MCTRSRSAAYEGSRVCVSKTTTQLLVLSAWGHWPRIMVPRFSFNAHTDSTCNASSCGSRSTARALVVARRPMRPPAQGKQRLENASRPPALRPTRICRSVPPGSRRERSGRFVPLGLLREQTQEYLPPASPPTLTDKSGPPALPSRLQLNQKMRWVSALLGSQPLDSRIEARSAGAG